MQEARFLERQEAVTVTTVDDVKQYTICVNEKEHEVKNEQMEGEEGQVTTYIEYVYDFNQFKDNSVDEEDVKEYPTKYLLYEPKVVLPVTPANVEERVATLEERQDMTEQALQDAILMIMEGGE